MTRTYSLILLIVSLMTASMTMRAQSDAQLTQYYDMPSYYNSGAVGLDDMLKIRGGARMQWVGIHGAPRSFLGTADMPVKLMGKRIAVGAVVMQESIGLYSTMNLGVRLAYHLKLWGGRLSPGIGVGFIDQAFKGSEVFIPGEDDYHTGSDDAIPSNDIRGTALDLSAGAWYEHRLFWAGVSVNHLNQPTITMNAQSGAGTNEQNYEFKTGRVAYFMAGSNIQIKNTLIEVLPSLMVKTDFKSTIAEVTGRVRYNKFLSAGLGYRYKDAVSFLLGAQFKAFHIGYSYDYPMSAISKASSGSHEIVLGYRMKLDFSDKNKNKHKSIRIM